MATSTKRVLTDDVHSALLASRSPSSDIIPEDLTTALQNLGCRVRKSVYDGYASQRITSATPTPHPSPVKPSTTPSHNNAVFRSANDTFNEIYSSPSRGIVPQTPSPKKRSRVEMDDEEALTHNGDVEMDIESDEEAVIFVLEPAAGRPIKPLRTKSRGLRRMHLPAAKDTPSEGADRPCRTSSATTSMIDDDWFSQPF